MPFSPITGRCLCGALRYEARSAPRFAGMCFCRDCQRASGSGFVPFMAFDAEAVSFSGPARQFRCMSIRRTEAVRNFCSECGALVFGGIVGVDVAHTVYAGTLDDPSRFTPSMAIFERDRPSWAPMLPGLTVFHTMPDAAPEGV